MNTNSITWFGPWPQLPDAYLKLAHGYNIHYIPVSSFAELQSQSDSRPLKLIGPLKGDLAGATDADNYFNSEQNESILWINEKSEMDDLIYIANQNSVYGVVNILKDCSAMEGGLSEFIGNYNKKIERKQLHKNLKDKNLELDSLNLNLKELVKARTEDLETSRQLLSQKAMSLKKLVSFVDTVSFQADFEGILSFLHREIKKFENIGTPLLMYTLNHQLTKIVSIQGGAISSHSCRQKKLFEELKVTRNEEELQLRLANELGRPFNRILPITLILNKHNFSGEVGALLMFEHQLGGQELHKFMEFITERLQAVSIAVEKLLLEDDFIENSKLWEYTFDGVENPIAIVDENFNLLRSNTHFQKNNKFTNCYEIFQGREAPCTGCPMSPNKNESAGFVSKNEKTYQVFSYPIKFESQSKVKVFVNYYLDVTRTKALQSKVIQNEKVAAIGHLAGNIAHELNNPLSGIKAMTQFLLQEIVDDKSLRDDINEVNKAVVRCQQIISNLLDFTKEGEAEDEEGSLTDLVATTLPLLKTILSDHNVEINLSNSVGKIKGSMPLIQQVIFNLVKNACQAIKVGPGSIQISTGSNDDYWSWFEIRDSGAGMSPGVIESIFEPFYTTKKEGDGTGLGLFISKNIVDKFKGTIEIKSHLGEGTTFKVSFPKINHKEIA